jgi:DNA-binding NtrC family response regulator
VDDHPDNNTIPRRLMEEGGATVIIANSTEEAMSIVERRRSTASLVISDMARGDRQLAGIELLELLRSAGVHVPLIVYSDNADARRCHAQIQRLGGIGPVVGMRSLAAAMSRILQH